MPLIDVLATQADRFMASLARPDELFAIASAGLAAALAQGRRL